MTIINEGREYLASLFHGKGAEIGTLEGTFAEIICKKGTNIQLFCIDRWKPHAGYRDFKRNKTFSNAHEKARTTLRKYNCTLIKKYSMDAVNDFEDNSLDFVYIDANHEYEHVFQDIVEWAKKVKKGGIISGHDYAPERDNYHVIRAVDRYAYIHDKDITIYTGDEVPSWSFIK